MEKVLECNELVGQIAEEIKEANDIFYLGRGVDYSLAMEGAFKNKKKYLMFMLKLLQQVN